MAASGVVCCELRKPRHHGVRRARKRRRHTVRAGRNPYSGSEMEKGEGFSQLRRDRTAGVGVYRSSSANKGSDLGVLARWAYQLWSCARTRGQKVGFLRCGFG